MLFFFKRATSAIPNYKSTGAVLFSQVGEVLPHLLFVCIRIKHTYKPMHKYMHAHTYRHCVFSLLCSGFIFCPSCQLLLTSRRVLPALGEGCVAVGFKGSGDVISSRLKPFQVNEKAVIGL